MGFCGSLSGVKFLPIYITTDVFNFVKRSRLSNCCYFIESCVSFIKIRSNLVHFYNQTK